jgi:peptide/nickel transport system substrate-binding protein
VNWLSHAERVDKYRVRVVTKQPFAAALLYLAYPLLAMQPNEYYARVGPAGMNLQPVGTGPYRVIEHALGKRLLLERNSDYYRGGPKRPATIERVEIRFIPDPQTRIAEVVAGGLDLVMNVARDQAEQMRTVPHLRVLPGGSYRYAFLQMNTTPATPAPQLRDIRVRQAIAHAIDRDALAAHLVGEGAAVLHTVCHPSQFGCTDAGAPRYAFDQDRARDLLREAGYPQGFAIDLYAYRDRNAVEAIMGYLAEVGIRAKLRYLQEAAVDTARHENRAGLMYVGYGPLSDIRSSLSFYHNFTPNDVNRDAEIRDLVLRGDAMMDVETRKGLYARGLALIAERAYALPLYSLPNFYVAAKDLEFDPPADETPRFYEMSYR